MRIDDFKVGDRVWSLEHGWGKIICIEHGFDCPIIVGINKDTLVSYTIDGKRGKASLNRSLFFEEMIIPESAYIRPKWRAEKREKYYCVTSDGMIDNCFDCRWETDTKRFEFGNYFKTEQEAKESKFYKVFHSQD
jgi:hypothetical protein